MPSDVAAIIQKRLQEKQDKDAAINASRKTSSTQKVKPKRSPRHKKKVFESMASQETVARLAEKLNIRKMFKSMEVDDGLDFSPDIRISDPELVSFCVADCSGKEEMTSITVDNHLTSDVNRQSLTLPSDGVQNDSPEIADRLHNGLNTLDDHLFQGRCKLSVYIVMCHQLVV